ncbi:MAG: hypothetical protein ACRC1P_05870 [Cellulosilyticaceae bacterium]
MPSPASPFIPFDLLSNFLTHTYLDTLEQLCHHCDYPIDESIPPSQLIKSLKSFLFIFQNNTRNLTTLQQQVFNYFEPYTYRNKADILIEETLTNPQGAHIFCASKRSLHIHTLRKIYSKNILSLRKHPDYTLWQNYNIAFLHIHRNLVYHRFEEEASIPKLLCASTANDFITCVWEQYLYYLLSTHNYEDLLGAIKMLSQSSLSTSSTVLNYLQIELENLPPSLSKELLLKKLI